MNDREGYAELIEVLRSPETAPLTLLEGYRWLTPSHVTCKKVIPLRAIDNDTYWWNMNEVRVRLGELGLRPKLGRLRALRSDNFMIVDWASGAMRAELEAQLLCHGQRLLLVPADLRRSTAGARWCLMEDA